MRFLTHNSLKSPAKDTQLGYPLQIEIEDIQIVESDFNIVFMKHIIPSLNWQGVLVAANAVGLSGFPETLSDELLDSEEFLQALHNLLLDMHVVEGVLVCPDTGHRFPINDGIPSFVMEESEVA